MTRRGFKPSNYVLYDLAHNDIDDYAPDSVYSVLCKTNGAMGVHILGSKLLFHQVFEDSLPLAPLHGFISRGRFMPLAAGRSAGFGDLPALIAEVGSLVVKPVDGQKGKRVHVLSAVAPTAVGTAGPGAVAVDGRALERAEFEAWLARQDSALVHDRVQQAAYADAVFPGSANTVRVVTVTDAAGPFVL